MAERHAPVITPPPVLPKLLARQSREGTTSCDPLYSIINSCTAATPNFLSLPLASAAKCFCFTDTSYAPDPYDSALVTCLSYLKTADPAFYTSIAPEGPETGPCKDLAAVLTSTAAPTANFTITPSFNSTDRNKSACTSWFAIQSSCVSAAPSEFTTAFNGLTNFSSEASCLCYTSQSSTLVFAPTVYDSYWGSCVSYFKTASPAFYSASLVDLLPESAIVSPCAIAGNVRSVAGAGSSSVTPTPTPTPTLTPTSTPTATTGALTTTIAATGAKTGGADRIHSEGGLLGIGLVFLLVISCI